MFVLSQKSKDRLKGVHPDLIKVVERAIQISPLDFGITEGVRSVERQKQLLAEGKSTTMNSRHIPGKDGTSKAFDIVVYINGQVNWDMENYRKVSEAIKKAAAELKVPVEWGGDWKSFKDGPHFQLPYAKYP